MKNYLEKNLKKVLLMALFVASICSFVYGAMTVTPGYTFGTTEQVTSAKLSTLVSGLTITGITGSQLANGTISITQMGAQSVGAANIVNNSITSNQLAFAQIDGSNIGTNSISGYNLTTNFTFNAGVLTFQTNQIESAYVNGATNSAGVADANKLVELNATGNITPTVLSGGTAVSSNQVLTAVSSTNCIWVSPVFSGSFTSTAQTITAGGLLTLAHGLGGVPTLMQGRLKNVTAEGGWVTGDEILTNLGIEDSPGVARGVAVYADATNIYVRYSDATAVFACNNKSTGAGFTCTSANWTFIIKAWR